MSSPGWAKLTTDLRSRRDHSSALGPNPVHTYMQPGSYEAVLTVTDATGKVARGDIAGM